jgi:hypothetical protein
MEEMAIEIFKPVLESATVLAAHYAKACGRDTIMAEDMRIGLMYSARNITGKQIGSLFPEIYDEDSDTESSGSWETSSEDELIWERYSGTEDDMALKMNECADTWDAWDPESPVECALKNAVDKQREQ